jgi:putative nucleotidyltransferase with HDIG domain
VALVSELSRFGRVYIQTVSFLGLLVIGESLHHFYQAPLESQWWLLAALTLISGSASVKLPWAHVSISISEAFVFTAVLLYGPAAGTLTVALDGLVISFWIARRRRDFRRAVFNIAAPAVSAWCSAHLFFFVSGIKPLVQEPAAIAAILPSLILYAITYFALNSSLIAIIIAVEKRKNAWDVWRRGFVWLSLNYFCGASVAVLLVNSNRTIDLRFVGIIVPLLLVLYFTFKTTMQRVEDANKHVEQLNALYLSTIETLAMAVDAKDQVTHGHIRRVQHYATQLARKVGIRDEHLLKAIEAAALLHDMGKLAIPEHILNKPGKLTPAEFDKMKLHASIGAEILSAIDFPYPVVPIVRHHHENWDGTGYPDGLKGTAVPIGARILSVVDCFDALTSDRPYRPALSDDDALKILLERRGSMYDPLVVDTFVKVYRSIAPDLDKQPAAPQTITAIASRPSTVKTTNLEADNANNMSGHADELFRLYELARALGGNVSFVDAGDLIAKHVRRLIPFSLCVFYIKDHSADELEAKHAIGDGATIVRGTRISMGQRLSGWVGANRKTICNSDSALDFWDVEGLSSGRLRSCLSSPLISGEGLLGVITLHSTEVNSFTDDHRRLIELIASTLSDAVDQTLKFDRISRRDQVTGLPSIEQFQEFLNAISANKPLARSQCVLVAFEYSSQDEMDFAPEIREEILPIIVRQIRNSVRSSDLVFRAAASEFVAFLTDSDPEGAIIVADRIRDKLRDHFMKGRHASLDFQVCCISTPTQGQSLQESLERARSDRRTLIALDQVH